MAIDAECLVAHRGYQRHFPENTLLAFSKAIACGARHVECDVQISADGVPVIYHDATLMRMSGCNGSLADMPWGQLVGLPAHEPGRFASAFYGEKLASLRALVSLMQQYPAVHFYIELKEEAVLVHGALRCLQVMADALQPVQDQFTLISFDLVALEQAAACGFRRIGPVLRDWTTRDTVLDRLGASVMFINKHRIPAGKPVAAVCPVVVYEVDDVDEARHWLVRGAAKVETFAIGELLGVAVP